MIGIRVIFMNVIFIEEILVVCLVFLLLVRMKMAILFSAGSSCTHYHPLFC